MIENEHIPHEDLVLYAMQAMHSHELAAVRLHLDRCPQCRHALAEINGDLALMAAGVDPKPLPAGARERFRQRLAADAQHRSVGSSGPVSIATRRPARRAAVWIGWFAAAASLLFAFSLQQKIKFLNAELARQRELAVQQVAANVRAQQVLHVLTAPTAQHVLLTSARTKPEPTGRAVYLEATGGLVFQANDLAQLAENKTYELWVIPADGKAPIPAGLFRPDAAGSASVLLPPLPRMIAAKAFGVTIEKAEGSPTPTAPIILSGAVPATGE